MTRHFYRLTSRLSGGTSDDYFPDAAELLESSVATRASLELDLTIRWAGTAIATAAVMLLIGFIAHLFWKPGEHYSFYVSVTSVAFAATGMFLHTLRYVVAWLTALRGDMRERADGQTVAERQTGSMFWLTTPRDSDFIIQFLIAGLVIFGVANNGA